MKFIPLGNSDARLIELVVHGDDRGNFARTWGVNSCLGQESIILALYRVARHSRDFAARCGDAFSTRAESRCKVGSLNNGTHS